VIVTGAGVYYLTSESRSEKAVHERRLSKKERRKAKKEKEIEPLIEPVVPTGMEELLSMHD
jgi:hypothetical protein